MKNLLVICLLIPLSLFAQVKPVAENEADLSLLKAIVDINTIDQIAQELSQSYQWGELYKQYEDIYVEDFRIAEPFILFSSHGGDLSTTILIDTFIVFSAYLFERAFLEKTTFYYESTTLTPRSCLGSNFGWYLGLSATVSAKGIAYYFPSINTSIIGNNEAKIVESSKAEHQLNAREYAKQMSILFELSSNEEKLVEKSVYQILMNNSYKAMSARKKTNISYQDVNVFDILEANDIENQRTLAFKNFKTSYNNYQKQLKEKNHQTQFDHLIKKAQGKNFSNTLNRIDSTLKMIEVREKVITDPDLLKKLDELKQELNSSKENLELEQILNK